MTDEQKKEREMRRIIAALHMSVDGFIEGPNGELDWVMHDDEETWREVFETLAHVDTFIVGRVMYPGSGKGAATLL